VKSNIDICCFVRDSLHVILCMGQKCKWYRFWIYTSMLSMVSTTTISFMTSISGLSIESLNKLCRWVLSVATCYVFIPPTNRRAPQTHLSPIPLRIQRLSLPSSHPYYVGNWPSLHNLHASYPILRKNDHPWWTPC
jgi:hypothetical protein